MTVSGSCAVFSIRQLESFFFPLSYRGTRFHVSHYCQVHGIVRQFFLALTDFAGLVCLRKSAKLMAGKLHLKGGTS